MLARLQQAITLSLLAFALGWGAWAVHSGHPAWAGAGLALIAAGYGLFMAAEFVIAWGVHSDTEPPRASARQLVGAWWGEVTTSPRIFCWQQPFFSGRHPDHLTAPAGTRGVLLVHGFVCNRGFWNRWMVRLRERDIPFVAVSLEPVFGSITDYVGMLEAAVRKLEQATGQAPVLVGHSMGGLAIRAWMVAHGGSSRVHRVITLGSPHRGAWTARYGRTANARQMRSGSELLDSLARSEAHSGAAARFICYYSHCDNIVFPASTATLPGADNRHVPGMAHVQLMDHTAVFEEVLAQVATEEPPKVS